MYDSGWGVNGGGDEGPAHSLPNADGDKDVGEGRGPGVPQQVGGEIKPSLLVVVVVVAPPAAARPRTRPAADT